MAKKKQKQSKTPSKPGRSSLIMWIGVAAALILHWVVAVTSTLGKSNTFDEITHLASGYSYWLTNDFRLNAEGGNFPQRWAALPVYWGDFQFPSLDQLAWWKSGQWQMGRQFFFDQGNDVAKMLFRGRAMIALLSVLLGFIVFLWSKSLYGPAGGALSLIVYTFSPTILAHGQLITSDMAAALGFTVSAFLLWRATKVLTPLSLLLSGLAMGFAFTAKMSGVLTVFIAVLILLVRFFDPEPLRIKFGRYRSTLEARSQRLAAFMAITLVHAIMVIGVIWMAYGFRYSIMVVQEEGRDELHSLWDRDLTYLGKLEPVVVFARKNKLLPEAYLYGLTYTVSHSQVRGSYLNGEYSHKAWRHFFPAAFLIKTPIPLLLMMILAIVTVPLAWQEGTRVAAASVFKCVGSSLSRNAPLLIILAVYGVVSINSKINIGHRHILPMYPPLFILLGSLSYWFARRQRKAMILVGVLIALLMVESARIYPHYLSYFNQLIGGPKNAHTVLVDSSLDWGQDLPGYRDYLRKHNLSGQDHTPVYLAYFGTCDPGYYDKTATLLPGFFDFRPYKTIINPLKGGVYCISATRLHEIYDKVAFGYWVPEYEDRYQAQLTNAETIRRRSKSKKRWEKFVNTFGVDVLQKEMRTFEQLRLARLCTLLRQMKPDDYIGYSILVYKLSDEFIKEATRGKPKNLYDQSITYYEKKVKKNPNDLESFTKLARMYYEKNMIPKSLESFRQALTIEPKAKKVQEFIDRIQQSQNSKSIIGD